MNTSESTRPASTINNAECFLNWMRTGSEPPSDSLTETNAENASDHHWRSLSTDDAGRDQIDRDIEDDLWPDFNPQSRRKDSEIGNLLDLLDNLPTGKESL